MSGRYVGWKHQCLCYIRFYTSRHAVIELSLLVVVRLEGDKIGEARQELHVISLPFKLSLSGGTVP